MTNETLDMLEAVLQDELERTKTEDTIAKAKAMNNVYRLTQRLDEAEESVIKWREVENRKETEEARIQAMIQTEAAKKRLSVGQIALELVKVCVPAGLSIASLVVYRKSFKEMGNFEETGHYTSNMSRELHLPKILK